MTSFSRKPKAAVMPMIPVHIAAMGLALAVSLVSVSALADGHAAKGASACEGFGP